jgi:hypothetical protein
VKSQLRLRTGFEIELVAPKGSSRRVLADEIALRRNGIVRQVWHHDSEPSLVPGLGRFLHLTQGFEVLDGDGTSVCTLVDDITMVDDLDARARPVPGWHRLLTDDFRVLRLIAIHADPAQPLEKSLDPVAALWGVPVQRHGDFFKVDDASGATIAMAAPLGGGRERPCEIVTPPLAGNHRDLLDVLLSAARDLGFGVPREAAVHLHYDGALFRPAEVLSNVIRLFGWWREPLRALLQTNPACRRLGRLPAALLDAVAGVPTNEQLRDVATSSGLSKFFDVNLTQLFAENPIRDTVEVRILPGSIDADDVVAHARLVEALLTRCQDPAPIERPPTDIDEAVAALRRYDPGPLSR